MSFWRRFRDTRSSSTGTSYEQSSEVSWEKQSHICGGKFRPRSQLHKFHTKNSQIDHPYYYFKPTRARGPVCIDEQHRISSNFQYTHSCETAQELQVWDNPFLPARWPGFGRYMQVHEEALPLQWSSESRQRRCHQTACDFARRSPYLGVRIPPVQGDRSQQGWYRHSQVHGALNILRYAHASTLYLHKKQLNDKSGIQTDRQSVSQTDQSVDVPS